MLLFLRRLRPILFPKNSPQERWAREALALYSRYLVWARRYARWQQQNEASPEAQAVTLSIQVVEAQAAQSPAALQAQLQQCGAAWVLVKAAPLQIAASALAEIGHALEMYPQADLVYTDGDHLNRQGRRSAPHFKPALGLDAVRARHDLLPFFAVRAALGHSFGWFDPAVGSAWAEDLAWRAVECSRQVVHIPKVLYHLEGAANSQASFDDEQRALLGHLTRLGQEAVVEPGPAAHTFRLRYRLSQRPLISIIIPNHNLPHELRRCVLSILEKSTYPHFEILIVENNSQESEVFRVYQALQARDPRVRLMEYHHQPFNYAEINNFAVTQARGEFLLFLNNDTEVISPDWLEQLLMYAQQPAVGVVGAKMYYLSGLLQHVGVIIGLLGVCAHHFVNFRRAYPGYHQNTQLVQNFSAVTAACLMIRRSLFVEVGGFDPTYRLAYNDIDLCLKIREQGYRVVWTPYAELYHDESLTRGYDSNSAMFARLAQERQHFTTRWHTLLQTGDLYYNPNLALDRGYFSLSPAKCDQTPRATPGLGINPLRAGVGMQIPPDF